MKELVGEELKMELRNLRTANGYGVAVYRQDYVVKRSRIESAICDLVLAHKSFPVGVSREDSYGGYLILENADGSFSLASKWEVSMLRYEEMSFETGGSLALYAKTLSNHLFKEHLNEIQIIG